ncbi:hypothetical protein SCP_0301950 [Sparassis crispa]|uniref:Uncharacterized protein n=1 Tax=Sparassis crispa TaxID=139825 RepID=A0A401GE80_9APHY|nr:hypothetical protein SCP_0301950 [Sparassis crispa]GBE80480.1 hypothetical protein SCP_0301950 [Sparassis crispa]
MRNSIDNPPKSEKPGFREKAHSQNTLARNQGFTRKPTHKHFVGFCSSGQCAGGVSISLATESEEEEYCCRHATSLSAGDLQMTTSDFCVFIAYERPTVRKALTTTFQGFLTFWRCPNRIARGQAPDPGMDHTAEDAKWT